ncbi:phenylalanine 4-monooxygenase [Halalkalibacillus sediminis]|uniref:Phenylalanine 4-monooxygenase n=1 Tax=Halalkalibacillus sediminis TaxID=2018042 RepID=A0A2I0QT39_9BACI|nr:aromatic amino acid hydroxylase [Halalkalibacillus sediminis]PKR77280.1 phenylalanine 4-monooxygenase [Halalkalibacillus sediminis]
MSLKTVPKHLKKYTANQHYESYTPINHSVWRFVMRQNHHTLKDLAHETYTDGLEASGITIEKIPNVNQMNKSLEPFGWGAATIDGFIPGVAFFEFQGNGVLPIATDIRKLENIQYTPAPDIIHEAAGHAPILCDETYSKYVKLFGEIGKKAIATKEEHEHFEALRTYSNLLEKGDATEEEIADAKQTLDEKETAIKGLSEAEKIGRLYWWTVEYGLIGTVDEPKIYGAGLLSSVAEGSNILNPEVKKIPFDVQEIVHTGFDITKPQPQLFVCESFEQLIEGLEEFAEEMAFKKGGTESLDKAIQSENTATTVLSSGLQITGIFSERITDVSGEAAYFKTSGPTALATDDLQIPGHGTDYHADGFGSPVGRLKSVDAPLEELSEGQLNELGIIKEEEVILEFESGVTVEGKVEDLVRKNGRLVLIPFTNCKVSLGDNVLFEPEWGTFDMAVGESIISVFAGAADGEAFYPEVVEEDEDRSTVQPALSPLEQLYQEVRDIREGRVDDPEGELERVWGELQASHTDDWLLRIEIFELLEGNDWLPLAKQEVETELERLKDRSEELKTLIDRGKKVASHAELVKN